MRAASEVRRTETGAAPGDGTRIRLLNYNIQTGMASRRYADYLLHSWKYFLPHPQRWRNIEAIAARLREFDIVALQETDPGSLRTGFGSCTEYLARRGGLPFWFEQTNREIGSLSRHGNAILCRQRPFEVLDRKLPGTRGRGALVAVFGTSEAGFAVISVHLALGRRPRRMQIECLSDIVSDYRDVILMGDLNCEPRSTELRYMLKRTALRMPSDAGDTFPSWRPQRCIDHILVTPGIDILRCERPPWRYSDHLPVSMEVCLLAGAPPGRVATGAE